MEAHFVIIFLIGLTSASGWLFKAPLKTKCYGKYGCFDNRKPFTTLPQSLSKIGTEFRLFTRSSSFFHKVDDSDANKLRTARFDGLKKSVIIVHGFQESGSVSWVERTKQALLNKEAMNVIVVNWNTGSNPFDYRQATADTQVVGAQIAELIEFLISYCHNLASNYHVIGFSLGAHVAGHAGRRLRRKGKSLGRISGLDPAGPLFKGASTTARLDSSDASFVDVVHTDSNLFGLSDVSGHIDFYPNGGADQGCSKSVRDFLRKLICDHMLAPEYYIASIHNKCSMVAFPCSSAKACAQKSFLNCNKRQCPTIGYNSVDSKGRASGTYFLYLSVKYPHCGIKPT